jgi:hypothetical protein
MVIIACACLFHLMRANFHTSRLPKQGLHCQQFPYGENQITLPRTSPFAHWLNVTAKTNGQKKLCSRLFSNMSNTRETLIINCTKRFSHTLAYTGKFCTKKFGCLTSRHLLLHAARGRFSHPLVLMQFTPFLLKTNAHWAMSICLALPTTPSAIVGWDQERRYHITPNCKSNGDLTWTPSPATSIFPLAPFCRNLHLGWVWGVSREIVAEATRGVEAMTCRKVPFRRFLAVL